MIKLENISKVYGNQEVLKNFSLEIGRGEHIAILGKSGGGKTTLIRLILGLTKPTSGKLILPENMAAGVVFQEDRLIEHLSAVGNVSVVHDTAPDHEEIRRLFEAVHLSEELIYKPVKDLSGGERRRVCIARALSVDADLYIFDEAFKGIDKETAEEILDSVKSLTTDGTLLLVTHDESEARVLCERQIRI